MSADPPPSHWPRKVSLGPYSGVALDGIINMLAGAGGPYDKATATEWAWARTMDYQSVTNLFRASWLARKIVTARNDDMLRAGILLDWDDHDPKANDSDAVKKAITRWKMWAKIREALYYKSLYGGSVIVLGIGSKNAEMSDLTKPLPMKDGAVDYSVVTKGSLRYMHVFDRWRAAHDGVLEERDVSSPNLGKPNFHILSSGSDPFTGQRVHWSRVIRFDGAWQPWITWKGNAMWMDSDLQAVLDNLRTYDSTTSAIASLIFEANIDVIKSSQLVKNLAEDDGEAAITKRYLQIAKQKSNYRMMVLDKDEEEYQRYPFQFSGLDKIWEKVMLDVSGATGYPVTRLFGQAPAGLNATGDADMRNYYDAVKAGMELDLRPPLSILTEVIVRNELGDLPPGFGFEFGPLWQPDPMQTADIQLKRAQRDKLYVVDIGCATPGLIMRELKEDGVFRTAEDEDVTLAEELSEAGPTGPDPNGGGVDDPPPPEMEVPKPGKAAAEEPDSDEPDAAKS
jgi:phage-related protein (TIGR01555 family)